MYDPQIGRWHVIDNFAEKYYSLNPYCYVDNNPLSNTDPTGDTIVFQYQQGQNILEFWEGVKTYVDLRNSSETAAAMFEDLANSENVYTYNFKAYDSNKIDNSSKYDSRSRTMSITLEENSMNNMISMGHETAHGWRDEYNLDPIVTKELSVKSNNWDRLELFNQIGKLKLIVEPGACHIENMIRSELGAKSREAYENLMTGGNYDLKKDLVLPTYIDRYELLDSRGRQTGTGYNYHRPFGHNIHKNHNVKPIKRR